MHARAGEREGVCSAAYAVRHMQCSICSARQRRQVDRAARAEEEDAVGEAEGADTGPDSTPAHATASDHTELKIMTCRLF